MQFHWAVAGENELLGMAKNVAHKHETRFRRNAEMEIDFFGLQLPQSQMHVEDLQWCAAHGVQRSKPTLVSCANLDAAAVPTFGLSGPRMGSVPTRRIARKPKACLGRCVTC